MNDPEFHLKAARLATPSASLDRRMQVAFNGAAREEAFRKLPGRWRLVTALAATGLAATFLFFFTRSNQSLRDKAPTAVTYRIESAEPMRRLFFASHANSQPPPQFVVSVSTP